MDGTISIEWFRVLYVQNMFKTRRGRPSIEWRLQWEMHQCSFSDGRQKYASPGKQITGICYRSPILSGLSSIKYSEEYLTLTAIWSIVLEEELICTQQSVQMKTISEKCTHEAAAVSPRAPWAGWIRWITCYGNLYPFCLRNNVFLRSWNKWVGGEKCEPLTLHPLSLKVTVLQLSSPLRFRRIVDRRPKKRKKIHQRKVPSWTRRLPLQSHLVLAPKITIRNQLAQIFQHEIILF